MDGIDGYSGGREMHTTFLLIGVFFRFAVVSARLFVQARVRRKMQLPRVRCDPGGAVLDNYMTYRPARDDYRTYHPARDNYMAYRPARDNYMTYRRPRQSVKNQKS